MLPKVCAERWNATTHQRAIITTPEIDQHDFADDLGAQHDDDKLPPIVPPPGCKICRPRTRSCHSRAMARCARRSRLILGENEIDPYADQPHLIKGLIREREVVAIAGVTGVGKTYLGMDIGRRGRRSATTSPTSRLRTPARCCGSRSEGAALVMRRWLILRKVKVEPYLEHSARNQPSQCRSSAHPIHRKSPTVPDARRLSTRPSALNDKLYRRIQTASAAGHDRYLRRGDGDQGQRRDG